jgi:thymidylate kinase
VDIAPETAARRKAHDRDRYERDLVLLGRVRESYQRQARQPGWVLIDGEQTRDAIAEQVFAAVSARLPTPDQ